MIEITNIKKHIGPKVLYEDLSFRINSNQKIGLIGRNGSGKSTLFKLINGIDNEYSGKISIKTDLRIIETKQEHHEVSDKIVLEYILDTVPKYFLLKDVIKNFESNPTSSIEDIQLYSDSLEEFTQKNYFNIEDRILDSLFSFGISFEKTLSHIYSLSGGEKRFVELVRVLYSESDLVLLDEPTNHMDYVGKNNFISWLNDFDKSIIIITHDRDVLENVDSIIEIKNHKAITYKGNYTSYLRQNSASTIEEIAQYEDSNKKLEKLKAQLELAKKTFGTSKAGTIVMNRFRREIENLEINKNKPEFWIDETSLNNTSKKLVASYDKYKSENIKLNDSIKDFKKTFSNLISVNNLSFGYEGRILAEGLNFTISQGEKLEILGRNGAGKSTLINNIYTLYKEGKYHNSKISGDIIFHKDLVIGIYDQEVSAEYMEFTLEEVITKILQIANKPTNQLAISQILSRYLFDPVYDKDLKLKYASGGQKARIQLFKMFSNNPNLIILDEPTNHLDLPSVEVLENKLLEYEGAVIYVSHDSYFKKKIGGKVIEINQFSKE